jgi:hypothetical protein
MANIANTRSAKTIPAATASPLRKPRVADLVTTRATLALGRAARANITSTNKIIEVRFIVLLSAIFTSVSTAILKAKKIARLQEILKINGDRRYC